MTPESPFAPVQSRESFLETRGGGEALRRLDDGLGKREPFLIVTGQPGTGKTAHAHEAIARWGPRAAAAFLAYSALSGSELLEEILRRFGAEPPEGASLPKLVALLERALLEITSPGQVAIVVVDDAHHLPVERLEELRLLVNAAQHARRSVEIMLVGLPALEARLAQPALAALEQRISVRVRIEPLPAEEVERYVQHRVTAAGGDGEGLFPRKTCRDIAALSGGVPRRINTLAAAAMDQAQTMGDRVVTPAHVRAAATALWGVAAARGAEESAAEREESPARIVAAPAKPTAPPAALPPPLVVPVKPPPAAPASPAIVPPSAPPVAAPPKSSPRSGATPADTGEPSFKQEFPAPVPSSAPSQDPREWVARFVGDKGPLQLSSRAADVTTWEPERPEPAGVESPGPEPARAPRKRRARSRGAETRSRSPRHAGARRIVTVSLAAIVVVGAIALVLRAGGLARGRARQATVASVSAPAKRVPPRAKPAREIAPVEPSEPAVTEAPVKAPAAVAPAGQRRPFTLEVGTYRDLTSALDARDRMQALTGFQGWVATSSVDGNESYRVVLGVYRSEERATAAANMLLKSRTLPSVTVVSLPPQSARQ